jgi:hypothetical protein
MYTLHIGKGASLGFHKHFLKCGWGIYFGVARPLGGPRQLEEKTPVCREHFNRVFKKRQRVLEEGVEKIYIPTTENMRVNDTECRFCDLEKKIGALR